MVTRQPSVRSGPAEFLITVLLLFAMILPSQNAFSGPTPPLPPLTQYKFPNGALLFIQDVGNGVGEVRFIHPVSSPKGPTKIVDVPLNKFKIIPFNEDILKSKNDRYEPDPSKMDSVIIKVGENVVLAHKTGSLVKIDSSMNIDMWTAKWFSFEQKNYFFLSVASKVNGQTVTSTSLYRQDGAQVSDISEAYLNLSNISVTASGTKIIKPVEFDMSQFETSPRFKPANSSVIPFHESKALALRSDSPRAIVGSAPSAETASGSNPAALGADLASLPPIERLKRIEKIKQDLFDKMSVRIFGQEELLRTYAKSYAESLITEMKRPQVTVVTGPSGVGKSFSAEEFAKQTFSSPDFFLEIDGTKYMSDSGLNFSVVDSLLGANPSHSKTRGDLTDFLERTQGDGVVVINEGDKIHPSTWKRLMELFDKGKIVNGEGKVIKSRRLYILITTNRGAANLFPASIGKKQMPKFRHTQKQSLQIESELFMSTNKVQMTTIACQPKCATEWMSGH